jgi:acetyltransferase
MKEEILSPKSIAIVGASTNPKGIGSVILQNLISGGYEGEIYPINPKYKEILGKTSYPDVLAIEQELDQVCIAIPATAVEDVVDQCIEKGVKSIVIISSGFKETGSDGAEREERIKSKVKEAGIRLLGPNCLGYINNKEKINLTFARKNPGIGSTAFISQSGAFCTAILDIATADDFGFSHVVSIGNKTDIYENELIDKFLKDSNVNALALYIEQFTDGKEYVSLVQSSKKPVVVVTPGSSQKAQEAISSHTGSLASSYDTLITAFRKSNTIMVDSSIELYDMLRLIESKKLPKGNNVVVVTNAGGPGVIATDNIEKQGLKLAELTEKSTKKLKKDLPESASVKNPVDILGDALADRYELAISTCVDDKNVDSVLVILTPQLITDIVGTAEKIIKLQEKSNKPIFVCYLGKKDIKSGSDLLREYGVYVSDNIEATVELIRKISEYSMNVKNSDIVKVQDIKQSSKYIDEVKSATTDETKILDDELVEKILLEHKIEIPEQIITPNIEDAVSFAVNKFPVVIKAASKDLAHKTDFKAIYLDIRTVSEFRTKIYELKEAITKKTGVTSPDILVQEMIEGEAEVFIGANREGDSKIYEEDGEGFGHLLAIGQGGIYTEVYKDIEHALIPTNRKAIQEALDRTKISTIINGYRGKQELPKEKLLDMLEAIQRMLISYPQIVSLDINPVILTADRVIAVDVKVYVKN